MTIDGDRSRYTEACALRRSARCLSSACRPRSGSRPLLAARRGPELSEPSIRARPSVADDYARACRRQQADGDALRSARQRLAVAIAALDEARKFAPPGAVEVPPSAFTTPFGRAMWDKEPGRFRLIRLDAVRAAYAQAAERL